MTAGLVLGAQSASAALFPKHPKLVKHRSSAGEWQLDVVRNTFSGEVSCRLRAKSTRMIYYAGAIGFVFKPKWDVHGAVYRFDRGELHAWRDDLPELVRLGAPIDQGGVENASAGIVWLPWRRLGGVNSVEIQPRADRKAKLFHLRGLNGLYESALTKGCSPDSRFVR